MRATIRVLNGERPPRPTSQNGFSVIQLSDTVWELITRCWDHDPECRPAITYVQEYLEATLHREGIIEKLQLAIERRELINVRELAQRANVQVEAQGMLSSSPPMQQ
jgi:hypothetical protein